ncbi:GMC oxidoreductase-domain-containing protein [Amylocarpus encephaloides]|uniref:GMC oxidoreductase-domain-containing protein n=1 Tax=Amylocarpus encephaloides TaxID=45428 RepID=A0A9P8C8M5_9HELO|nr:GMC oxidoreductase-domain-containing protein [Amylocarpus encephaloides]
MSRKDFDFIIIGGSTAGNVVAGWLAQSPNASVLIIEARKGNPRGETMITTPARAFETRGSEYDWAYKTTFIDRPDYTRVEKPNTRGKILGGSSCLNYYTWIPGSAATLTIGRSLVSVTYHDDEGLYSKDLAKVCKGGPLHVAHADLIPEMAPFRDALTQAWTSKGEPVSEDIYSGEMHGLTHCINSIYKGLRSSSYVFVEGKPNITILADTHSKKIIIEDGVASGVAVFEQNGEELIFCAKKEVIVSSGVFESPKLLMLSGLGSEKELVAHGIKTLVKSEHVGQNLLDHPIFPYVFQVLEGLGLEEHLLRAGPSNDGAPTFSDAFQWHIPTPPAGAWLTVIVDLLRPISQNGTVKLNSADPLVQPNININFFSNDLDIIAMRQGVRFVDDILRTGEGFKDIIGDDYPRPMPRNSDEAMNKMILERSQTGFHPCGTTRL